MNGCDDGCVQLAIGEFGVRVRSEFDQALGDLATLYRGYPQNGTTGGLIRMEVTAGRRTGLGSRRYTITGDGRQYIGDCHRREVLPYLEWGINSRVIDGHPEYLQLHAAALERNGCGVLFVGGSGCGKSTLAAALLSRGWHYLSDELALIQPETLRVHGFPKALCIKEGSFALMKELDLPLWRRRHLVKTFKGPVGYINPRQVNPAGVAESAPVGQVVFVRYVPGREARFYPVSRAQAVFSLTAYTLNRHQFGPPALSVLGDLVRTAGGIDLNVGPLQQTCRLIESLI